MPQGLRMTDDAQARRREYLEDLVQEYGMAEMCCGHDLANYQDRRDRENTKKALLDGIQAAIAQARREGFEMAKTAARGVLDGSSTFPNDQWSKDMKIGYDAGTCDAAVYYDAAIASLTYPEGE
jgi:hypothetical protein